MKRVAIVCVLLTATAAAAQSSPPKMSRTERAALQAIVAAADGAKATALTPEAAWPIHVLRASDGSHYVAFSIADPGIAANQPLVLYVRLASRRDDRVAASVERSAVAEWLAGQRSNPLPPKRGFAFGDMPTFGPGAIAARGPGPQNLQLLDLERDRAREREEARNRERKAELEGEASARTPNPLLPFEDFDLRATPIAVAGGVPTIQRSLTAGPGEYELTVAWVDPAAKSLAPATRVMKRSLTLPIASTTAFSLSDVIIADEVGVQDTPHAPEAQTAHPYSIGTTRIVPAKDDLLTNDERLALIVQVINARAAPNGKPDVVVAFRLSRVVAGGIESVGTVNPLYYNQSTLPADFDGLKAHPLFAAIAIPLRTFKRGTYRLQVLADDRLGATSATSDTTFRIVGTPVTLLRAAPPVGGSFRRESMLEPAVYNALIAGLRPASPSVTLARLLDAARDRRFVDLVRAEAIEPADAGTHAALRGIALYGLGDTPTAVCAQFRQAIQQGAPAGPVHAFLGACRALENNDRDAVTEWQSALAAGLTRATIGPALAGAHLRLGDVARANEMARESVADEAAQPAAARVLAATLLASGREAEAITALDALLASHPEDIDAQWLLLHALFTGFVRGNGSGATLEGRARFARVADMYVAAKGRHAALASEWLALARPE